VPIVAASPAMRRSPSIIRLAPIDWAASSMTGSPGAAAATCSSGAICPNRSTGTTALVRGVTAAATAAGDTLNVAGSMSTNTGVAPTLWMVPAVAKKVNGVVTTSSPRPTSSARSASSSASVPFAQPTAYFVCESPATAHSSFRTGSPRMKACASTTSIIAATTLSRMVAC
jgi:hypothetical protein